MEKEGKEGELEGRRREEREGGVWGGSNGGRRSSLGDTGWMVGRGEKGVGKEGMGCLERRFLGLCKAYYRPMVHPTKLYHSSLLSVSPCVTVI